MMPKVYIEREAAIIGLAASSLTPHQIDDAAEALKLVPAADVRPVVKADWYIDDGCAYCSNCKNNFNRAVRKIYKFCPMCGADMRRCLMSGNPQGAEQCES